MGRGQELLDAAREGQRHTVEKIVAQISKRSGPFTSLRRVPDVNVQDDSGYTPLHHACLHGHKEIVRLLLSSDASPCIADKQGATPLHLAAFKGDTEIVSMLLAHDNPPVNIDHRTAKHETPLLIAAHFGFTDIVAKLIEKGADVTIRNIHNESALDLAAQFGKLKTVQHLLYVNPHLVDQYKPPMSRTKVFPMTPLNLASKNGHKEVVSALLEAGFDPNVRSYEGTPLHEAARFYRASVVRILLEHGADLRIKDRRGNTVYDLLADNSEKATKRVRKVIREYENKIVSTFDSDEDLPPFPVHECSPTPTSHTLRTAPASPLCTNINASDTNLDFCETNSLHGSDEIYINVCSSFNSLVPPEKSDCINIRPESDSDSIASSGSFLISQKRLKILADSTPLLSQHNNVIKEIKSRSKNTVSDDTNASAINLPVLDKINETKVIKIDNLTKQTFVGSQLNRSIKELKQKPQPSPKPKSKKTYSGNTKEANSNNSNLVTPQNYDNFYHDEIYQNLNYPDQYENLPINNECVQETSNDDHVEDPPLCSSPTYLVMLPIGKTQKERTLSKSGTTYRTLDKNLSVSCDVNKDVHKKLNKTTSVYSLKSDLPVPKQKLSIPNFFTFGTKRKSVHLKGDPGCIFDDSEYQYVYELNPDTISSNVNPFVKKREKVEPMPCFCHEDPDRYIKIIDMLIKKRRGFSVENIYIDVMSGNMYSVPKKDEAKTDTNTTSSSENNGENVNNNEIFVFEPFTENNNNNVDVTDSEERRNFTHIVAKKFSHIKQLFGDWKAPETQKNTNNNDSLFSQSSSSLTKNHPQSFVKKLASKCLGLKAKFNSAPNISNSGGLENEVDVKLKRADNKSTNTLLIGNSKFFKILSKKEDSGEIVCNDEFDTISLDRLGSLNRDSVVNRSNRSCPGFKTSLPNISENNELSDSNESVVITEIDCNKSNEIKNANIEAINYNASINIFEPRDRVSVISGESANLINECYESFYFSKCDNVKDDKDYQINSFPHPAPRPNVIPRLNSEITIYENVAIEKKTIPTPAARTNVPQKLTLDTTENNVLYENISLIQENKPAPPKRNIPPLQTRNFSVKERSTSPNVSCSSTLSSDSMVDESNLEDIFLSQKSKSFRHSKISSFYSVSGKSDIFRTPSNSSNDSDITEASAIENIDCSDDIDKNPIYLSTVGTLPNKKTINFPKKKVLFRHKTFTNIEIDRNSVKVKDLPQWNTEFLKETLANYHIRGTGHCVHKAPTILEFISFFNRDTLNLSTNSSMKNDKRDSYYETGICFCKPRPLKNYKSAENLLDISQQNKDSKVIIDINALKHQQELTLTSFRCFCDSENCSLHSKHRESPTNLVVKFSAIKRSISTPDITLENSPSSIVKKVNLVKNKSVPRNLQEPYPFIDVNDVVDRNKSKVERINSHNTLSQPSTLSTTSSVRPYSIKDIAEVISLNSTSTTNDSLSCASDIVHLPLRKSSSSEYSGHWSLQSCNSNVTVKSDMSFKTCIEESSDEELDETLHSDADTSDAETIMSDVSTSKRPWVHTDSFRFACNMKPEITDVISEKNSFDEDSIKVDSLSSKVESGISLEGSESSSSECGDDSGIPRVDANVSLGTASLERVSVVGGDCSGSGRRRWDETEGTSEGDALSVSSAASSCAPLHLAYHNEYNKVSSAKQYLKLGRSVDHYVDGKLSYVEYEENQNSSPRIAPVPHPRPSLKQRTQPVAITAMYENVVIKEQNPRRKLRRNSFVSASESIEIRMNDNRTRKYSNQERSSLESLLDNQSMNSPSNLDGYCDAPKIGAPLSPTHYDQPPTPDHPPPSAKQAEKSIHEKIRPLSQLIMEVVEEIRIRKKSQGDVTNS